MSRNPRRAVIVFLTVIGLVLVWHSIYPSGSWRYRLTIAVDTPDGLKTGSGVIQVSAARQPRITPESGSGTIGFQGEAVVVDLGDRGLLFVLLTNPTPIELVNQVFPFPQGPVSEAGIAYYSELRAKADVPPSRLPMFVRFRDANDSSTVELVAPNDLARSFGHGVSFKTAVLQMVDAGFWPMYIFGLSGEPVSWGIESRLLWLDSSSGQQEFWKALRTQVQLRGYGSVNPGYSFTTGNILKKIREFLRTTL